MKKILIKAFIIFLLNNLLFSKDWKSTYYISPGIGISLGFSSNLLFVAKVSFGRMVEEEYYYNITIGGKYFINKEARAWKTKYLFFEPQYGSFLGRYPISGGGGLGFAYFKNEGKFTSIVSLFGGKGLFFCVDYLNQKQILDGGLRLVIPYPFNDNYRNSN